MKSPLVQPIGGVGGTGSGEVSSVSNNDGTLIISPTIGNVVASLNLALMLKIISLRG